ncbi:MAG: peptide chain release factor N(5)-glutamine methyltransferase [Bryobacterales bacterium]|nr:peptide chain release factor N(5)-glutamine methyltransferase [Bryobacterales bacterium]
MTVRQALDQGARLLEDGAVGAARLTAEVLLCHALGGGRGRSYLYAHGDDELTELAWIHFGRYLHERLQGKPTQYITKVQEWYGREFRVSPAVLIPRPETEHVIEVALQRAPRQGRAIDIGCGSGAVGVTWQLETGMPTVLADLSVDALAVALGNARALGAPVTGAVASDLDAAFGAAQFDVVLSNPPYIPDPEREHLQREVRDFEPPLALFGGPTGVEIYARLLAGAARILKPGGWIVMEIGYQAEPRILELLRGGPWSDAETQADLAGWPRVISAQLRV